MLLTTTNNNLFDTFFSDPWFNDPWFDDRDVQKAQKKLYGHNGKRMMLTDIKESDKGYELESFLTNFGTVTGTVSTGMILLREIDPNYVTPAASNIVLQNIPSLVMLAPLLLTMGFAASSLQHTLIMLGVYAFLLIAYNIFLFRLSIFKKRYTGAADELSAGVHDR